MRPLHVLVFLLPLLIAYEIGSILYLRDSAGAHMSVSAYRLFGDFFKVFGLAGAFLPGVALVVVFMVWHVMVRDRWTIDWRTLGGMAAESVAWNMPLLVLAAAMNHARSMAGLYALAADATSFETLPTGARLTIAVGAGLYEEMLFRLVGLALLHFILVDLIGMSARWGFAIAILLTSLAFAVYHQPRLPEQWPLLLFATTAGIYFGTVYVMRGFGIVVATHALYDVLVLVVFNRH
jgi:membrane protease YdiL (CAAX protease family)